ncbi:hypothetical protein [Methylobacterium planeticum]|uniref:Uncharacterized protein n=1 Tax=Methylobacterium planeticum TaxID=2615211 RepID=A0A6N6MVT3_9HYPH|nr:hypothetical protein [Methylobacterium planeticum]KAB1074713.1 hypothetical protein F6X51_06175 [Methylobacterium planeticum]
MNPPVKTTRAALCLACALAVSALAAPPALAHGPHHRGGRPHHHHVRRALPPGIAYRDPRELGPPPRIVRGYLPRNDAVPMYNEPPPRFPTR